MSMLALILKLALIFSLEASVHSEYSNGHYHWLVGNPNDFVVINPSLLTGGVALAGGGGDVDSGMRWFLRKAVGGDVVVFRNAENGTTDLDDPNADRYNQYFYAQLGVAVDSVETILFNGRHISYNLAVIDKVRKAEAVFFGGGDQWYYYDFLQGTPLLDTLNDLINVKRAVIGGTSAGCAIQSEYGFTAELDTIASPEALADPYDPRVTLSGRLLRNLWLENLVVDQHYGDRNRFGRHVSFMARVLVDQLAVTTGALVRGIGVDERTVVCVDRAYGIAYAFGSQKAYFIQQMNANYEPEVCRPKQPLHWYRGGKALNVYQIQADDSGMRYFNLRNWDQGVGGQWTHFYVDNGQFNMAV